MADKIRYPQIPSTVWWGVRSILQKTPSVTVDERLLGVQLGVQEVAARAYINELKSVAILTEDGKATSIAQKWRIDDTYREAVDQIINTVYPEGLIHLAPAGSAERQKVVSWFLREGLGQGAAGNKAATYLLLSSPTPNETYRATSKPAQGEGNQRVRSPRNSPNESPKNSDISKDASSHRGGERKAPSGRVSSDFLPLNINVQIHISADAGTEQIESIFQAMRRYLYDVPHS